MLWKFSELVQILHTDIFPHKLFKGCNFSLGPPTNSHPPPPPKVEMGGGGRGGGGESCLKRRSGVGGGEQSWARTQKYQPPHPVPHPLKHLRAQNHYIKYLLADPKNWVLADLGPQVPSSGGELFLKTNCGLKKIGGAQSLRFGKCFICISSRWTGFSALTLLFEEG